MITSILHVYMEMADIGLCDESAFHKSCRNSLFHGHACAGEDQFNCSNNKIVEIDLLMENLEISDADDLNDLMLEECENLLVKKTISNKTSQFCTELKDLSKCAAVICSKALQSCPSSLAKAGLSAIELGNESSVSNPSEDGSVPYHDSLKFVSALKGSRARQGKHLHPNLHVTWAANVYDPPITSSSHTVKKPRHHLPKAKPSDHHKRKHMKAKPSYASSADRKHSHRRASSSFLDPRMARMQAFARTSLEIQALDIAAASAQESSKCGGIFHAQSPWPLPHPVAEAS